MITYKNPIVLRRADPHVTCHVDGWYYFTASVPEYDRIELRRSKTIQGLGDADGLTVWTKHASGVMSFHIWAPELHWIDGCWYIYFAAGRVDSIWEIRIYALSNPSVDPMQGNWTERGQIKTAFESFSLDATTFEHFGQRYLVWAQKNMPGEDSSDLFIAKLADPVTIQGLPVMISTPNLPWERIGFNVNEGPSILKRNGKIFISYSASATDHHYCMGLLTASDDLDLLNPVSWKKSPYPVMTTSEANGQYGPGHNSFTVAEDGKTDVLIYHARPYRDCVPSPLQDPNRHTRAQAISYDSEGNPIFGMPVKDDICE